MSEEPINPYVGLRPFEMDESLLFFGRTEQTMELLQRLHRHHFLAVVGSSGCGKSSLLRAGLIPLLKAGFLVNDSDLWSVYVIKPGKNPLHRLARAILEQVSAAPSGEEVTAFAGEMEAKGAAAITEKISASSTGTGMNYFLLVDQFEEIFRFAEKGNDLQSNEAIDFVSILIELAHQTDLPFYVVITMRSDFIGDCARFYGLPEEMNQSQYLVPRLNRLQLRAAIEGPARLGGLSVEPMLTSLLLNNLGKVRDELPVLQHLLLRIWEFEKSANRSGMLDIDDYNLTGGIENALSKHAEDAHDELNKTDQLTARLMFQALTTVDDHGRKIRRPVSIDQLVLLTGADKQKIREIIGIFTCKGRSFLVISKEEETGEEIVDISHESLIRQWTRLNQWVSEEYDKASTYKRLAEAMQLFLLKKKGLLEDLELRNFLEWRDQFLPTESWASQYNPEAFSEAMRYLEKSEKAFLDKVASENRKARILKTLRWVVIVSLLGLVGVSAFMAWNSKLHTVALTLARMKADEMAQVARMNSNLAINEKNRADLSAKRDSNSAQQARLFQNIAEEERRNTALAMVTLSKSESEARRSRIIAEMSESRARQERDRAETLAREAIEQKKITQEQKAAFVLHAIAMETVNTDPTLALRLEEEAISMHYDSIFSSAALKIFRENAFYRILGKQKNGIIPMAISPDGKFILTGSADHTARLWSVDGRVVRDFSGHNGMVGSVAFFPDGTMLMTASRDGSIRLWGIDGKLLKIIRIEQAPVMAAALAPDGKKIIAGSTDKSAYLLDLQGNIISRFRGHTDQVNCVAFSPNGNQVLTGSDDHTARVWNLKGRSIAACKGHSAPVVTVGFSPDGLKIFTGSEDNTLGLWNLRGHQLKVFKGHTGYVVSFAVAPDGLSVLTGSWDKTARLWDIDGRSLQIYPGHTMPVTSVAFIAEGKQILTTSWDKTLRVWDRRFNIPARWNAHDSKLSSFAISGDGNTLVTGAADKTARLWTINGTLLKMLKGHSGEITAVDISRDGRVVLTASSDKTLRLWQDNEPVVEFRGHRKAVTSAVLVPGGGVILSGSADSTACIWNRDGTPRKILTGHRGAVRVVECSHNGKYLATGSDDKTAILWDQDGNRLASLDGHISAVTCMAFSPDDRILATGSADGSIRLWNLSGTLQREFRWHNTEITALMFSPDGTYLITTNLIGKTKQGGLDGRLQKTFWGEIDPRAPLAFSPDGKKLISGNGEKGILIWTIDNRTPEEFLRTGNIEPLSPEQRKQYLRED